MKKDFFTKRVLALFVAFLVLFSQVAMAFVDVNGHWAEEAIKRYNEYGIVNGYNDKFNPNDYITRGDLAIILDKIMGYQVRAINSFNDLEDKYYTDAVLKVNAAGVITGYEDGLMKPTQYVTRQEVAIMICKTFRLNESVASPIHFNDESDIASWAKEYVDILSSKGYISGFEGNFYPKNYITRAEMVSILNNIVTDVYNTKGIYTKDSIGSVVVNTPGVTLKNMTISGDLILADGIAEGNANLDSINVKGRTIIRGGGANSIYISGTTNLQEVIIEKNGGTVRIKSADGTIINDIIVDGGSANVIISGDVKNVTVNSNDITVNVEEAIVDNMIINSSNSSILVNENSEVSTVVVSGENVSISGEGRVIKAELGTENVEITTKNTTIVGEIDNKINTNETKDNSGGSSSGTGYSSSSNSGNSSSSSGAGSGSSSNDNETYSITFKLNDGYFYETSKVPVTYTKESKDIMLPVPYKNGYIFEGWYETDVYTTNKVIKISKGSTGDKVFFAKWYENNLRDGAKFPYGVLECEVVSNNRVEVIHCDENATEVEIPENMYGYSVPSFRYDAFSDCDELEKLELANGMTNIWYESFSGCIKLEEIIIPDTIENIGEDAFEGTKWLENKRADDSLVIVNDILVDAKTTKGEVIIPESVKKISNRAFAGAKVTEVVIPTGIKELGYELFSNCEELCYIEIPESVNSISEAVFEGTKWLEDKRNGNPLVTVNGILIDGKVAIGEVMVPEGIETIGIKAFYGNDSITRVIIPETVKEIKYNAFGNCKNLKKLTVLSKEANFSDQYTNILEIVDSTVVLEGIKESTLEMYAKHYGNVFIEYGTEYEEVEENGYRYIVTDKEAILVEYMEDESEVIIPNEVCNVPVTKIGVKAFYGNDSITRVTIPKTVKEIGYNAFGYCENLEDVNIPKNVTIISSSAFNQCKKIAIYGDSESYAEKFAKKMSIDFFEIISVSRSNRINNIKIMVDFIDNTKLFKMPDNVTLEKIEKVGEDDFNVTLTSNAGYAFGNMKRSITLENVERSKNYCFNNVYYRLNGTEGELYAYDLLKEASEVVIESYVGDYVVTALDFKGYLGEIDKLVIPATITKIYGEDFSEDLVIYGEKGSTAEEFAIDNGIKFVDKFDGEKILTFNLEKNWVTNTKLEVYERDKCLKQVPNNTEVLSIKEISSKMYEVELKAINGYVFEGGLENVVFENVGSIEGFIVGEYEILPSNKIENGCIIIDYLGESTELEIPKRLEGYDVVEIACVFPQQLEKITILDNVKSISSSSFKACRSTVTIYGYVGTVAQKVALDRKIKFIALENDEKIIYFDEERVNLVPLYVDFFDTTRLVNLDENVELISIIESDENEKLFTVTLKAINGYVFSGGLTSVTFYDIGFGEIIYEGMGYEIKNGKLYLVDCDDREDEKIITVPESIEGVEVYGINCHLNGEIEQMIILGNIKSISSRNFSEYEETITICGYTDTFAYAFARDMDIMFLDLDSGNKILFCDENNIKVNFEVDDLVGKTEGIELVSLTKEVGQYYTVKIKALDGYVFEGNFEVITLENVRRNNYKMDDNFEYELRDNFYIVDFINDKKEKIEIPKEVCGIEVYGIDCELKNIYEVIIWDNIKYIDEDCFEDCEIMYVEYGSTAMKFAQKAKIPYIILIDNIEFSVAEPTIGETIESDTITNFGSYYGEYDITWYDSDGNELDEKYEFCAGLYKLRINIILKEDCQLYNGVIAKVNDDVVEILSNEEGYYIEKCFEIMNIEETEADDETIEENLMQEII